jgi:hypothetical protein
MNAANLSGANLTGAAALRTSESRSLMAMPGPG